MKRLACIGGFISAFLAAPFVVAQIPSPDNIYVLQARPRQATTTTPLTLTFTEPFKQKKNIATRQTAITIPASDVIDSLTVRVRAEKFAGASMSELFVLDVRSRRVSANTGDPLVLTLASGAIVAVPSNCVHVAATRWLRVNLPNATRVIASPPVTEPDKSAAAPPANQDLAAGASVQFDAKGVDFSPWLRRFIAQIKRNWFVPESVMNEQGHVVVTFRVQKDGRITEIAVKTPSAVEGFNRSAFGALSASNPTYALPPEYPEESAFFTVTFSFNETPSKGG